MGLTTWYRRMRTSVLSRGLERDILTYSGGKLLIGLGAFLMVPLLTRTLGMAGYGRYGLLLTATLFLSQLGTGWFQQAVLRYHSGFMAAGNKASYIATLNHLLRRSGLLIFTVVLLLVLLLEGSPVVAMSVALFGLARVWHTIYTALNQSELKPGIVVTGDLLRTVTPVLMLFLALWLPLEITTGGVFAMLAAGLAGSAWYHSRSMPWLHGSTGQRFLSWRRFRSSDTPCSREKAKKMVTFGIPVGLWMALSTLQILLGRTVLDVMQLEQELGLYTAFQDVTTKAGTLVFIPVIYAIHPRLMAAWNRGERDNVHRLFGRGLIWMLVLCALFAFVSYMIFPWLMSLLFSASERQSLTLEPLIGLFLLFVTAESLNHLALMAHKGFEFANQTRTMLLVMLGCLAINVLLLAFLAAAWGLFGVIFSLIASRLLYFLISVTYTLTVALNKPLPDISD